MGFAEFVLVLRALRVSIVFMGMRSAPQGIEYTVEHFGRHIKTLRHSRNLIVSLNDRIRARMIMMDRVLDVPFLRNFVLPFSPAVAANTSFESPILTFIYMRDKTRSD